MIPKIVLASCSEETVDRFLSSNSGQSTVRNRLPIEIGYLLPTDHYRHCLKMLAKIALYAGQHYKSHPISLSEVITHGPRQKLTPKDLGLLPENLTPYLPVGETATVEKTFEHLAVQNATETGSLSLLLIALQNLHSTNMKHDYNFLSTWNRQWVRTVSELEEIYNLLLDWKDSEHYRTLASIVEGVIFTKYFKATVFRTYKQWGLAGEGLHKELIALFKVYKALAQLLDKPEAYHELVGALLTSASSMEEYSAYRQLLRQIPHNRKNIRSYLSRFCLPTDLNREARRALQDYAANPEDKHLNVQVISANKITQWVRNAVLKGVSSEDSEEFFNLTEEVLALMCHQALKMCAEENSYPAFKLVEYLAEEQYYLNGPWETPSTTADEKLARLHRKYHKWVTYGRKWKITNEEAELLYKAVHGNQHNQSPFFKGLHSIDSQLLADQQLTYFLPETLQTLQDTSHVDWFKSLKEVPLTAVTDLPQETREAFWQGAFPLNNPKVPVGDFLLAEAIYNSNLSVEQELNLLQLIEANTALSPNELFELVQSV